MSFNKSKVLNYKQSAEITFNLRDGTPCAIIGKQYTIGGIAVDEKMLRVCVEVGHAHPTNIEYVETFIGGYVGGEITLVYEKTKMAIINENYEIAYCTENECFYSVGGDFMPKKISKEKLVKKIFEILDVGFHINAVLSFGEYFGIEIPPFDMYGQYQYTAQLGEYETSVVRYTDVRDARHYTDHIDIDIKHNDLYFGISYHAWYGSPGDETSICCEWNGNKCSMFEFQKNVNEWRKKPLVMFSVLPLPISDAIRQHLPLGIPKETL